jgi:hypothetical protein
MVYSCSSSTQENTSASRELTAEQQEVSDLEDQVIAVHDEVMPLMDQLISLQEELKTKNADLESSGDADAKDQVIVNSLIIDNLSQAHEGMMDWMRKYEPVDLEADHAANMNYLQEELEKITAVQELTDMAITAAEETLGE